MFGHISMTDKGGPRNRVSEGHQPIVTEGKIVQPRRHEGHQVSAKEKFSASREARSFSFVSSLVLLVGFVVKNRFTDCREFGRFDV